MAAQPSNQFTEEHENLERANFSDQQHESSASENKQSDSSGEENTNRKDKRGFASMDAQLQRQIASKGGRAAHQQGVAHEFNSSEAREAGRKGGVAVSKNRQHMAEIGKKGGEAAHNRRKKNNDSV